MEGTVIFLLLTSVILPGYCSDGNVDPIPDKCNRLPEFTHRKCCKFPPFFSRDISKPCEAYFELLSVDKANITALRRKPLNICDHWKCILQKHDLLNLDETLNDKKYFAHLHRWALLNRKFMTVMKEAKIHCINIYRIYLPLRVCEFFDIHGCIRNYINVKCPVPIPTKKCLDVNKFFDECREFYL